MGERMGERILQRCRALKLRQVDLAALLHVSPTQINRYVKGRRRPDAERLQELARILKCKPSWLRNED